MRGGVWGKLQGARSTRGVAATLCFGDYRWLKFLLFFLKQILYLSIFYNFPPVNNITSEIFKKKEVRQTQKRGKNQVWWDLRGRSDLFCWGAWGAWGRERSWRWGDPSMAIAEGLVERWASEVSLGHHTFPEHRGLRVEQWGRTACARYCSKHLT